MRSGVTPANHDWTRQICTMFLLFPSGWLSTCLREITEAQQQTGRRELANVSSRWASSANVSVTTTARKQTKVSRAYLEQ